MDLIPNGQKRRNDGMAGLTAVSSLSEAAGGLRPESGRLAEGACRASRPLRDASVFSVQQKNGTKRNAASR